MPRILDTRSNLDSTIRIFDSFYALDIVVNGPDYDIVHGYFISVCNTKQIADNFTAVLFRISNETGYPVLDLLDQIKGTKKMEMNQILAYYLNSFKSKTSLYGLSVVPPSNQPAARNIVQ